MWQVQNVSQSMEVVDLRTSRDLQYVRDSEPLLRGVDGRLHTYVANPRALTAKGLQVLMAAHTSTHIHGNTPHRQIHTVIQTLQGTHNLWCENIDFTHAKLKSLSCTETHMHLSSRRQNLSWSCRFPRLLWKSVNYCCKSASLAASLHTLKL